MSTWIAEPRSSLVVGDGRPISAGAPARALSFPWPSTLAGMVRSRIGLDAQGVFTLSRDEALAIAIGGPWLAVLDGAGQVEDWAFPAPADAVWFDEEGVEPKKNRRRRLRLRPTPLQPGESCDREGALLALAPCDFNVMVKVSRQAPAFWTWRELERWLMQPVDVFQEEKPGGFGLLPLTRDRRVHVAIDPERRTADDGRLFMSEGLCFRRRDGATALAFVCERPGLEGGVATLGGERRLVNLRSSEAALPAFSEALVERITETRRARVLLLTPGIFAAGYAPTHIGGAEVSAAAVGRPLSISGWDVAKGRPKPSRRAAPAGSVYWVDLPAALDPRQWLEGIWLRAIADEPQDQRDGFALSLVGVA